MNCLGRFLQFLKDIFRKSKIPIPSSEINPQESVSRFIFESNKFKKQANRVSPQAFAPPPNKQQSVYRVDDCSNEEIWELSDKFITPLRKDKKTAKARGDILVCHVLGEKLKVVPHTNPHPRHANIIGWPDDESKKLMIQTALANKATLVIRNS